MVNLCFDEVGGGDGGDSDLPLLKSAWWMVPTKSRGGGGLDLDVERT
jgi:hypothetical protein